MNILYIYPHPDDESFGPAHVMSCQKRLGHEVHLLTLTRGGATKQRHKYGYSVEEMGRIRNREMFSVEKVLGLSGMTVLDLPDNALKEMDPREIERIVERHIESVQPQVVVTYPVHGISGFHDHLITHAVVKRVFADMKERRAWLRRLAFITLKEEDALKSPHFKLSGSTGDEIDCIVTVEECDIANNLKALDCYATFQETIEKSGIRNMVGRQAVFEIFQENHTPPLSDLFEGL